METKVQPKTMGGKEDTEGQAPRAVDVDAALEYLNHGEPAVMTEIDEKKLVRKIDWWIVPLMCKFRSQTSNTNAEPRKQGLAIIFNTSIRL